MSFTVKEPSFYNDTRCDMTQIFLSVVPIFLLIALGYGSRWVIADRDLFWKVSDKLVYYLFFPALLIVDISESDFSGTTTVLPILSTIVATLIVAGIF